MASKALIITSVLTVIIGYALYTPLPEGVAEPWKLRMVLATLKMMHAGTYVGERLGFGSRLNLTRTAFSYLFSTSSRDDRVKTVDASFDGVKVRIYRPVAESQTVLPGLVYYHGGGWTYFSVDTYDPLTSYLAAEANIAVVSVEYRLAPEYPFPAPFDDCVTATVHLLRNAKNYKIDPKRIGIAGDSAGGNLAAAVALKLRDDKVEILPRLQGLIYPVLQLIDLRSPSRIQNSFANGVVTNSGVSIALYLGLESEKAEIISRSHHLSSNFRKKYEKYLDYKTLKPSFIPIGYKPFLNPDPGDVYCLSDKEQEMFINPYVSPLVASDHSGLPPAFIFTAGKDTLRDDGFLYAKRLKDAGVETEHLHIDNTFHGVFSVGLKFDAKSVLLESFIRFLKTYL